MKLPVGDGVGAILLFGVLELPADAMAILAVVCLAKFGIHLKLWKSFMYRTAFVLLVGSIIAMRPSSSVRAGTVTFHPRIAAVFEDDGMFTPLPFPQGPPRSVIYQVHLLFTVSELTANERGLLNMGFSIDLPGGDTFAENYVPHPEPVDVNGNAPGGVFPKFFANGDGGPSTTDYQGIFATIAPGLVNPLDPRVTLGQASPELLGSLFINRFGMEGVAFQLRDFAASFNLIAGTPMSAGQFSPTFFIPWVPEPASIAIAVTGLITIIGASRLRARRVVRPRLPLCST
jgi:hypothetical protein